MRSSDITKSSRKRPKQRKPEPSRSLPPISPRGFAVDLTPSTKRVSKEARGAAMIARGGFTNYLKQHDEKLGPGQKKALNILREDRTRLLHPKNQKYLAALQRARPDSDLGRAIRQDPHLSEQHKLLKAGISLAPSSRLLLQHKGMTDEQIDRFAAGRMSPDKALAVQKLARTRKGQKELADFVKKHGIKPGTMGYNVGTGEIFKRIQPGDIGSKFFSGGMESILSGPAAGVYMLSHDPRKTIPKLGKAIGQSYYETVRHPLRQIEHDPFETFSNVLSVVGAGTGIAGRVGGLSKAVGASKAALPSEAEIAANASLRNIPFAIDRQTGLITRGKPGGFHGDIPGFDPKTHQRGTAVIENGRVTRAEVGGGEGAGERAQYAVDELNKPYETPNYSWLARMGPTPTAKAAIHGFTHPEFRSPWELYEQKSGRKAAKIREEEDQYREDLLDLVDDEHLTKEMQKGLGKKFKATKKGVAEAWQMTKQSDAQLRRDRGLAYGIGDTLLREVLDGTKAGTIYLRPGYLPNNWAGNTFLNLTQQGFLAPINIAKSLVMHRHLTKKELAIFRNATGQTPIQAYGGGLGGPGFARALTDPVARTLGRVADQPFRDAAVLHELRRMGYRTIGDVKKLVAQIEKRNPHAAKELSKAGRRGQNAAVKFTQMNDMEKKVASKGFFVYNWVKGASKYSARYPFQHPIQTAIGGIAARDIGRPEVEKKLGGTLPPYLAGSVPLGGGRMFNPFSVMPLSTGIQTARALQGTAKEVLPQVFGQFDPHVHEDLSSMLAPPWASLLEAREVTGGRSYVESEIRNIAPWRLYQNLRHPGRGGVFPTTRTEALGQYFFGTLFPRKYDPKAITAALERLNINHPEALIAQQQREYHKKTGEYIPKDIEAGYRRDIEELKAQREFKTNAAVRLGKHSYNSLPPKNKALTALDWHKKNPGVLSKQDIAQWERDINDVKDDTALNGFANSLWSMTNAGSFKSTWNALLKSTKVGEFTPERK